jgi:uncharacterized protein GlcG (DUF336 family)
MLRITLDQANAIITAALAEGQVRMFKPLTVAVLDAGGHLLALQRQDGASNLRPQIASSKASAALALGISSSKIADMAAERPTFVASLAAINANGMTPAAGGVIVVGDDGYPIGAVGITGDTSENDEQAALVGIAAAGLTAQG